MRKQYLLHTKILMYINSIKFIEFYFDDLKIVFKFALYYQNIKNPIQRVNSVYNDTILNRVLYHAERARLYGFELGTNLSPKKWMSLYFGANIYNYKINGDLDVLGETSTVDNSD